LLEQGLPIKHGFAKMDPMLPLNDEANLGPNFPHDRNEIHVLVKVPIPRSFDHQSVEIHELLLRHVLIDAPSPRTLSDAEADWFKERLVEAYQCQCEAPPVRATSSKRKASSKRKTHEDKYAMVGKKPVQPTNKGEGEMLRCMLLDTALPSELVVPVHLFRRCNDFMVYAFMGFGDTENVKNALLLFKPLKDAMDRFEICFLYDRSRDEFRLKLLDGRLRSKRVVDALDKRERETLLKGRPVCSWTAADSGVDLETTTFGALEGRALCFRSQLRPYRRCLDLQARSAGTKAAQEKWIEPREVCWENFWSDGMSVEEKMILFREREDY
jgi:hypothetical protein